MSSDQSILPGDLTPTRHHFYTEMATEIVYKNIVQPGDSVLDLGANRAHHTAKLLEAVGERGRVHAFEPNPDLFADLACLGANLRLWPFAVGDCLRMVDLHVPEGLDGWSSLQDIRGELPNHAFKVRATVQIAIDEIAELREVEATFVKIDVERREKEAIAGMAGFLRRCEPVVVCEGNLDANFAAFEEIGFRCFDFFGQQAGRDNILANFVACPTKWQHRLREMLPTRSDWQQLGTIAATL